MKKTVITTLAVAMIVFASPVFAQENDLPPAGITPASPFFFAERFFEGIGTFFTFGNEAKAERYLALALERLSEAKALAEEGDERAQDAVALYEEQYEKAKERAAEAEDFDLEARVTDATTRHLSVLDEVLKRIPEQAREQVSAAKERTVSGQIEALRGIAQRDPEAAVDIFARAAEGRLNAAQARADRGGDDDETEVEDVEKALEEFERYAAFGNEISTLAEGIQTGETTVDQLVERATSHYRDVLRDVQSKVPPQAQQSIQRALESAGQLDGRRPAIPTPAQQPQRSIPENSIERVPVNVPPQAGQGDDEVEVENENEAGGPPAGTIPAYPGGRP